ncbi:MAG: V-type ATP synthase subunit A, partial [Promethearchaeota archaeon]
MTKSDSIYNDKGYISAIYGSLIEIKGFESQVRVNDLIKISDHKIFGEILQIYSDHVIAQCFENTNNLKLREEVINTGEPLSMELSPGLLTHIFDGIQRPLELAFNDSKSDGFLERGFYLPPLSRT